MYFAVTKHPVNTTNGREGIFWLEGQGDTSLTVGEVRQSEHEVIWSQSKNRSWIQLQNLKASPEQRETSSQHLMPKGSTTLVNQSIPY